MKNRKETTGQLRASRSLKVLAFCLCFAVALPGIVAGDWPHYRGDSRRSGYTAKTLPKELAPQWTYKSGNAPRPAWPGRDTRMPFDQVYHTVISGDTLFFGSSADCKVYALDAITGKQQWAFFTGGPVRLAPVVWKDRVFVVSDDGFLYCLAAKDGKIVWKLRGGPADSMVIGNDRMVSRWPARGGPVIDEGILYFAAGIWPSEGIFLYAIDAASGKVLWCNDTDGSIHMLQPHVTMSKSGISAQGYLAVDSERIFVPTGRGVPAVFNRSNGKLLHFHLSVIAHAGGAGIVVGDGLFVNDRIFAGGSSYDSIFAGGSSYDTKSGQARKHETRQYQTVLHPGGVLSWDGKKVNAHEWSRLEKIDRRGKTVEVMSAKEIGSIACPYAGSSLILAGTTIVSSGKGPGGYGVSVVDIASKKPTFSAEVDGDPLGLAVAGGRLYVSTTSGRIYCFGPSAGDKAIVVEPTPAAAPYGDNRAADAAAEEIVRKTGVTEGYCADLACGDGALAYALAKRTKLQIYAMESDPKKVALAREKLDAAGLYGSRVVVHQGDPKSTGYPNYFANLVVSGRSVTEGPDVVPARAMHRIQRPCGGVSCIGTSGAMKVAVRGAVSGAGTWTHQYASAANTNCSVDAIKGPLGVLWFTDFNFQMPNRHGRGPAPLFLNGRMFVEGIDALLCVDAYNGRRLWKYPLPGILKHVDEDHYIGASAAGSNVCVTDEGVFVAVGGKCLQIDPATGKLLREFQTPEDAGGKPGVWGYVASTDGTLLGTLADTEHNVVRPDMTEHFTQSNLLFAFDTRTAQLKWRYKPKLSIRHNAICIGDGKVFLIDRELAMSDLPDPKAARRTGKRARPADAPPPTRALLALNLDDGKIAWQSADEIFGTILIHSKEHDVLLMAYDDSHARLPSEKAKRMAAFRASKGTRIWDVPTKYGGDSSRAIVNDRTIYKFPGAWDLLTGKRLDYELKRQYGCGTLSGSRNLILYRSGTLGYTDLTRNYGTENFGGTRPGCWINTIVAGGMVLMPDASARCTCSYLIKASLALHPYGVRPPQISPRGGTFTKQVAVKVVADTQGVDIRYTTDGSAPTLSSMRYAGPITLRESAKLKVRIFDGGKGSSQVNEETFVIHP